MRDYFEGQIRQSSVILVVIGPQWENARDVNGYRKLDNPNDYVRIEVATALQEAMKRRLGVMPLLVDNAPIPDARQLPPDMKALPGYSGMPIRPGRDFEPDMQRLYAEIEQYGVSPIPGALPPAIPVVIPNPVRGPLIAQTSTLTAIPTAGLGLIFTVGSVTAAANSGTLTGSLAFAFVLSLISGLVAPLIAGLLVARRSGAIGSGVTAGMTSNGIASLIILGSLVLAFFISLSGGPQNAEQTGVPAIYFIGGLFVAGASLAAGLLTGWIGALIGAGSRAKP